MRLCWLFGIVRGSAASGQAQTATATAQVQLILRVLL